MNKQFILTLLWCFSLSIAMAQVHNDSVRIEESTGLTEAELKELTTPLGRPQQSELSGTELPAETGLHPISAADIELYTDNELVPQPVPDMHIDLFPRGSRLPQWATGYLSGYNGVMGDKLNGYLTYAGLGLTQQLGEYFTLDAAFTLSKYSVYYNTAAFNSSLTWHPNRYFSTTVFGVYNTSSFLSSVPVGPSFQWGGYITLQSDTDVPFGIDAGARDFYDPLSGHYVTPIVKPFVKLGDAKIGIDVGPLIQDAIRNASGRGGNNSNGFSPIPKPQKILPTVGPRR